MTFQEIAARVGCSISTVSRAVNGTSRVAPAVRRRILSLLGGTDSARNFQRTGARGRPRGSLGRKGIVEILLFRPDTFEPLSQSLGSLSFGAPVLASSIPFLSAPNRLANDSYRRMIDGIVSILSSVGIGNIQRDCDDLLAVASSSGTSSRPPILGTILMGIPDPSVSEFLRRAKHPVVLADILGVPHADCVSIDNAGGIRQAVRHLLDLGHRRFSFIGNTDNLSFRERYSALVGELFLAGIPPRPSWVLDQMRLLKDIEAALIPLLRKPRNQRPTAILCACDHFAIAALAAAHEAGLRVPQDLSIVGFDDADIARLSTPPLTTLHVPMTRIGAAAAECLLMRTDRTRRTPPPVPELRCSTELVVRASTGPAPSLKSQPRHTPIPSIAP